MVLKIWVPTGYIGPIPTPFSGKHPSVNNHMRDLAAYTTKELKQGSMLSPFTAPTFPLWCQTNPLLTKPKKNSRDKRVIIDLSWTLPLVFITNGDTPKDTYHGQPKKVHLPSAQDMADMIKQVGK